MEAHHDKILSDYYELILEKLNVTCLLPNLKKKKLVTDEEYQLLEHSNNRFDASSQFFVILKTKGRRAFSLFLDALSEDKNHPDHKDLWSKLSRLEKQVRKETVPYSDTTLTLSPRRPPLSPRSSSFPSGNYVNIESMPIHENQPPHRTSPGPIKSRRMSTDSCSDSSSSLHTLVPYTYTEDDVSSVLGKQVESLMATVTNQLNQFKVEISDKIQNLEKKIEAQTAALSLSSSALTRSFSSQSSGRSSFVYDKSYDNLDSAVVLTNQVVHNRPRSSQKRGKRRASNHYSGSDFNDHDCDHEKVENFSLPAIKSASTEVKQSKVERSDLLPLRQKTKKSLSLKVTPATKSTLMEYDHDFQVICSCKHSQLLPHIQDNELHLLVPGDIFESDICNKTDTLKSYNLVNKRESTKRITGIRKLSPTNCKLYSKVKNLSLVCGEDDASNLKLSVYCLDIKSQPASWELFTQHKFLVCNFDLENFIPVSHKDNGVIIVSVLNHEPKQANPCIKFHIFSQSTVKKSAKITYEKSRKSALLQSQISSTGVKYKIQSCVIASGFIYCSLMLHEKGACILGFDLGLLEQHHNENINPVCSWQIEENSLTNCFLSVLRGKVIIIGFYIDDYKTVVELRRPEGSTVLSPVEFQYVFNDKVKILTASIVLGVQTPIIAVAYHNYINDKCYVKRINAML